jgi:hypothetical protein
VPQQAMQSFSFFDNKKSGQAASYIAANANISEHT